MNAHKRLGYLVGFVLSTLLLVGCDGKQESVTIKVGSETMQEVSSWGDEIVVFTSAKNPINSLGEISVSDGEAGMWGPNPNVVIKFLKTFGQDMFGLQMIGDVGEGTKLFCDNPELRLFITSADFEKYILDTGCGIKVIFEEE
jgi:hypothetical protein